METGATESYKERAKREKGAMQTSKDSANFHLKMISDSLENSGTLNVPFGSADKAVAML